jgi:hypothetical protein
MSRAAVIAKEELRPITQRRQFPQGKLPSKNIEGKRHGAVLAEGNHVLRATHYANLQVQVLVQVGINLLPPVPGPGPGSPLPKGMNHGQSLPFNAFGPELMR